MDLKAAFDTVSRKTVVEAVRGRGVREGLVEKIEEVLRETRCRVRIGEEEGEGFWTARGVRQGCPMSPILFNLILADLEEELRKVKWGGARIGEERVYSLLYADDTNSGEGGGDEEYVREIGRIHRQERLRNKCRKDKDCEIQQGRERRKRIRWRWKGKTIEEVREYTYLGYRFQANEKQQSQIKERVNRAAGIIRDAHETR